MNQQNENAPETGYASKSYQVKTKRYFKTLTLADDPKLIEKYKLLHSREKSWKIVRDGIRSVGILEMELFIYGTTVCMVMETPMNFDLESAMDKLSKLPMQQEWENLVSVLQNSSIGKTSADKWHLMERFFYLY
jgi:L-rhamnose mutarotase